MGKFVISVRKNEDYQFNLQAANGQVILSSQGYKSKAACDTGIESVRINSADDSKFESLESGNDKFYFNLKAANGQVIGTSQMYTTKDARDNGIASVKTNAPDATVEEA